MTSFISSSSNPPSYLGTASQVPGSFRTAPGDLWAKSSSPSVSAKAFHAVTANASPAQADLSKFSAREIRLAFYEAVVQRNQEHWINRLWREIADRRNEDNVAKVGHSPGFLVKQSTARNDFIAIPRETTEKAGADFLRRLNQGHTLSKLADNARLVSFLQQAQKHVSRKPEDATSVANALTGKRSFNDLPSTLWLGSGDVFLNDTQRTETKKFLNDVLDINQYGADKHDEAAAKIVLLAETLGQLARHQEPTRAHRELEHGISSGVRSHGRGVHPDINAYRNEMRCAHLMRSNPGDVLLFPADEWAARPPLTWPSASKAPLVPHYRLHPALIQVAQGKTVVWGKSDAPTCFNLCQEDINQHWPPEHSENDIATDMKRTDWLHVDTKGRQQRIAKIDRQELPDELLDFLWQGNLPRQAQMMAWNILDFAQAPMISGYQIVARQISPQRYELDITLRGNGDGMRSRTRCRVWKTSQHPCFRAT